MPSSLAELITAKIRDINDYPRPGVLFKDITPLLADGKAFAAVIAELANGHRGAGAASPGAASPGAADHGAADHGAADHGAADHGAAGHRGIDKVAGIEARGFILAAPVACALGAGFVPVRKQGKLPAPTHAQSYQLEYGTATIEVHVDAFQPGDRVLIVDDVLATGGTAAATAELVRRSGGDVAEIAVLIELGFLNGREKLADLEVRSLLAM